ncbi:MAG: hypothetical protein AAGJ35_07535, partial [Myxococcota bacterium]
SLSKSECLVEAGVDFEGRLAEGRLVMSCVLASAERVARRRDVVRRPRVLRFSVASAVLALSKGSEIADTSTASAASTSDGLVASVVSDALVAERPFARAEALVREVCLVREDDDLVEDADLVLTRVACADVEDASDTSEDASDPCCAATGVASSFSGSKFFFGAERPRAEETVRLRPLFEAGFLDCAEESCFDCSPIPNIFSFQRDWFEIVLEDCETTLSAVLF